jgi:cbb3-type cytochrome oxidase subunit 1
METKNTVGIRLVQIAAIYMVIGLGMGLFMAVAKDHTLSTVHSHLSLLGWMTMGIAGLIYMAAPSCVTSPLARWHFWLHNVGLPIMIVSLALKEYGNDHAEKFVGLGSIVVLVALVVFAINVLKNLRRA